HPDVGRARTRSPRGAWIYALCVVVMVPVLMLVSRQPDFADYYPMYKLAGRSWLDFLVWEAVYLAQFFPLEFYSRGFWLRAMRTFGSGAIFSIIVPYCMIHYGKPYHEAMVAVIAGVVLGAIAMRAWRPGSRGSCSDRSPCGRAAYTPASSCTRPSPC